MFGQEIPPFYREFLSMMVISYTALGWPLAGSASAGLGTNETRLKP
jgi:hypothetical protein